MRAVSFVLGWSDESTNAAGFAAASASASQLARSCLIEASRHGITAEEIEEEFPSLVDFFTTTLKEPHDRVAHTARGGD